MTLEAKVYELADFWLRIDPIIVKEHISAGVYKYHALVCRGD
jgi:hypothetical protein